MDADERAGLRAKADVATPGPWQVGDGSDAPRSWVAHASESGWDDRTTVTSADTGDEDDQERKDAEFIAATRTAVPALLDDIERLEAALERVREALTYTDQGETLVVRERIRRALNGEDDER